MKSLCCRHTDLFRRIIEIQREAKRARGRVCRAQPPGQKCLFISQLDNEIRWRKNRLMELAVYRRFGGEHCEACNLIKNYNQFLSGRDVLEDTLHNSMTEHPIREDVGSIPAGGSKCVLGGGGRPR